MKPAEIQFLRGLRLYPPWWFQAEVLVEKVKENKCGKMVVHLVLF